MRQIHKEEQIEVAKAEKSNPKNNWIKSLLCYRKQTVKLNSFYSDWAEVLSGIPRDKFCF